MQEEIRKNIRYNFKVNIADATFFGLALGFASSVTVIPLFLNSLTNSTILIGLIASMHNIGWTFPQLFTSGYVSRMRRYKPFVIWATIHERWPFFGLAIVALAVPALGTNVAIILTLLMLGIHSFGGGVTATPWQSMIGKVIPANLRGTFFGMQSAAANLLASGGALIAGFLLERIPGVQGFALCFFIAGIAMTISFVFLARAREPVHELPVEENAVPKSDRHKLMAILKRDKNFRWFLVARVVAQFGWMAVSFYTIYAVRHFQMDEATAGVMTSLLLIAQTIANPILGWMGDRWGHRLVYALGGLMIAVSATLALVAPDISWFYLVFALAGASNATIWATVMSLTLEFSSGTERPLYIGLANTLIFPAALAAPLIGGWLSDSSSFQAMFVVSIVCAILTMIALLWGVTDPRHTVEETHPRISPSALEDGGTV